MSSTSGRSPAGGETSNLADVLERVLDKGVVIAGDIQVNLLDIELLTIKLRLIVASVDTARRMGIRWWENDPSLAGTEDEDRRSLSNRVRELERQLGQGPGSDERDPQHELEQRSSADE
ncbi:MAG TPA: gas vesicle protein [Candidatus Sulfotelmatobacter sp.]|nr:gas vesicle protein [Candidatus Sulfotelmatobacter sp.]